MKLKDRVAIVTGSGRGIGKAIAHKLASEGASVVVCALHIETARQTADEIKDQGYTAFALKTDVTKQAEVHDLVKNTLEQYGKIDILINNAGATRHRPLLEMTEEDWDFILNTDLKGTFFCTQAVLKEMMERRYGKIINISSSSGIERTSARPTMANYADAKAGVVQLTKFFAKQDTAYDINVNCIAPGLIMTDIMYLSQTKEQVEQLIETKKKVSVIGRVGEPDDVANLTLFLASDDSSFITAQVICIDGGTVDRL